MRGRVALTIALLVATVSARAPTSLRPYITATAKSALLSPSAPPLAEGALQELSILKARVGPALADLRASNGWCLDDTQLEDLKRQKVRLAMAADYLSPAAQARLVLSVEVAYQSRVAAGKVDEWRHAIAVARMLTSIRAEGDLLEAALLAGVGDGTGINRDDVEAVLGSATAKSAWDVGAGVSKVWKLSALLERSSLDATESEGAAEGVAAEGVEAEQLERQCQILLAGCDTAYSIIISLASRLVSTRELQAVIAGQPLADDDLAATPRRANCALGCVKACALDGNLACAAFQQAGGDRNTWLALAKRKDAFAQQTLEVFVPLAERLGMWYFKTELETLSFAITSPIAFAAISSTLDATRAAAEPALALAQTQIEAALAADPVLAANTRRVAVRSRVKDVYSVWRKMERKGLASVDELDDVLAFRLVLYPALSSSTGPLPAKQYFAQQAMLCYRALEVVHRVVPMALSKPTNDQRTLPVQDYIHTPKANGYRSLHSKALLATNLAAEIQIRTAEMHAYAEHGRAAHWLYKHDATRREVAHGIWVREAGSEGSVPSLRRQKQKRRRPRDQRSPSERGGCRAGSASTAADADTASGGARAMSGARRPVQQLQMANETVQALSELHSSLRSRRVVVTSEGGVVVSLEAGTSVETALRSLEAARSQRGARSASRIDSGARLRRAIVNGRAVRAGYIMRNGDVLDDGAVWAEADASPPRITLGIEEQASSAVGVSADTTYWAERVPWPWSLIQSDFAADELAWEAEAERKHGNVALIGALTWLWLLAFGWVSPDAAPLAGLAGFSGACWAMQFGTYGLFEARSLLRRRPLGPSLGPLEPPRWLGRVAMVVVTSLALRTDVTHDGGVLHELLEPPLVMQARPASAGPPVAVDEPLADDFGTDEAGLDEANMVATEALLSDMIPERSRNDAT